MLLFQSTISLLSRAREWVGHRIFTQKLNNPLGLMLLLGLTLPLSWMVATFDIKISGLFFLILAGVPLVLFCLFDLVFAMSLMLVVALAVPFAAKFTNAPIGTLLDLLILLGAVGLLLRQIKERDWNFIKVPLSYMVLIWLYYNILQVLNPWAESKMAWLYTVRSVAVQQAVFFIGAYAFSNNRRGIMILLKLILAIGFISALYGLKQQFIGFSAGEEFWIYADRKRFELYYQWGMLRIPSFCYDPTTFGILMACFALFCTALFLGPVTRNQRILLGAMIISALWVMAYTGTRTAFALVPVGGFFYGILILNKRVLMIGGFMMLLGTAFVLKSTSSGVVYRIQSAFKPGKDDSMNLRLTNQKKIQPFIQNHPLGGGLGSCGMWGERFNPDSELSKFPHDSSFVRMGVELGWLGLMLYTLLHFFVLRTGIYYFIRCRDPLIKAIYAGITTWMFMLAVACYAQEAILQLPMNVIYNVFLAMLVTLKNFDPAYN
jgi:putative inorganic carbon (hco3(-)) transporter